MHWVFAYVVTGAVAPLLVSRIVIVTGVVGCYRKFRLRRANLNVGSVGVSYNERYNGLNKDPLTTEVECRPRKASVHWYQRSEAIIEDNMGILPYMGTCYVNFLWQFYANRNASLASDTLVQQQQ